MGADSALEGLGNVDCPVRSPLREVIAGDVRSTSTVMKPLARARVLEFVTRRVVGTHAVASGRRRARARINIFFFLFCLF